MVVIALLVIAWLIVGSMVKSMKQEFKVDDTLLQCFDALVSSTFIELSDSSVDEDLTSLPSLTKSSKRTLQFGAIHPCGGVFNMLFLTYA